MPADFNAGAFTIAPGDPSFSFSSSWGLFGVGPVVCMFSPDRLSPGSDHKIWITQYGMGEDASGNTYYSGLVSNNSSQALSAHLLMVWWPEFQADWNA